MGRYIGLETRSKQLSGLVLASMYWLAVFAGSCTLLSGSSVSNLFVWYSYAFLFFMVCVLVRKVFIAERRNTFLGQADPRMLVVVVIASLVAGVILEGLTLFGASGSSPFVLEDWGFRRIAVFSILFFTSAVVIISAAHSPWSLRELFAECKVHLNTKVLAFCAVFACLCLLLSFIVARILRLDFIPVGLFCAATLAALVLVSCSRVVLRRIEWFFLVVSLSFGLIIATQVPVMTGISWDDQIHYKNALNLSYLTAPELVDEEIDMADMAVYRALGKERGVGLEKWSVESVAQYEAGLDIRFNEDVAESRVNESYLPGQLLSFTSLGYIPSAIGLWCGRLLCLPFSATMTLGRIGNLISYCLICFSAIRISPVKKVFFTVVALIPMNIFLAANYSYDPWLVSMLLLGTAMLFKEMWGKEGVVDFRKVAVAALVMFFGLCVKAVYFPLIGLFFLMPQSKFESKRQRNIYYLFVVLFGLYVLASFAIPFLFGVSSGTEAGDTRGGSDVSSGGQLSFILANPFKYIDILKDFFVGTYLNPAYASGYTLSFSYLANSHFGHLLKSPLANYLPVIILAAVAFFDNEEGGSWKHARAGASIWAAAIYLVCNILVATALYVSFTPVGHGTVNGCQFRYLLPITAPTVAVMLNYSKSLGMRDLTKRVICLLSLTGISFCTFCFVVAKYAV